MFSRFKAFLRRRPLVAVFLVSTAGGFVGGAAGAGTMPPEAREAAMRFVQKFANEVLADDAPAPATPAEP